MQAIPQRNSLVSQAVAFLDSQIAAGQWREWLPPERTLCESMQVSRSTLRRALEQMQRDGRIQAVHGTGNRIVTAAKRKRGGLRSIDVALLVPDPIELLRPTQVLWIDELRGLLSERGCRLHILHGQQYFRANPGAALEKLVRQHPHGCWILALATPACQQWFARRGLPCVVAGSCHAGVDLPFRDLDHRATCRHAAGVLLGLGHRKLALIAQKLRFAGDIESETGFVEGVRASAHADATVDLHYHDATATGIAQLVKRLMTQKPKPTALLVANAYHCLAAVSALADLGWRVPADVSVISRDEGSFLAYLVPTPARYIANPRSFARSLLQPVLELLAAGAVSQRALRLMPQFERGASVAGAPPAAEVAK